jgi:hypothetical protein
LNRVYVPSESSVIEQVGCITAGVDLIECRQNTGPGEFAVDIDIDSTAIDCHGHADPFLEVDGREVAESRTIQEARVGIERVEEGVP